MNEILSHECSRDPLNLSISTILVSKLLRIGTIIFSLCYLLLSRKKHSEFSVNLLLPMQDLSQVMKSSHVIMTFLQLK